MDQGFDCALIIFHSFRNVAIEAIRSLFGFDQKHIRQTLFELVKGTLLVGFRQVMKRLEFGRKEVGLILCDFHCSTKYGE